MTPIPTTHSYQPDHVYAKTRDTHYVLEADIPLGIPEPPYTTNQGQMDTTQQLSRTHIVQLIRVGPAPLQPHGTKPVHAATARRKSYAHILPHTRRRSH